MMKKRGVSLVEVILSASMILVVMGIVFTLVIGTSRRINILEVRKETKDSMEGFRDILGDKLRGITSVDSISESGDELEFSFEEGVNFTQRSARVYVRSVSGGKKQLVIQFDNRTDILLRDIDTFKAELYDRDKSPVENIGDTGLIKIKVWINNDEEERIKDEFIIKVRRVY